MTSGERERVGARHRCWRSRGSSLARARQGPCVTPGAPKTICAVPIWSTGDPSRASRATFRSLDQVVRGLAPPWVRAGRDP
jgi:hypothetical protein